MANKKYNIGGSPYKEQVLGQTIGSTIGQAGNLLLPGLGSVLSPVLGTLGSVIGKKSGELRTVRDHLDQMDTQTNPYQLQLGGLLNNDPPDKKVPKYKITKELLLAVAKTGDQEWLNDLLIRQDQEFREQKIEPGYTPQDDKPATTIETGLFIDPNDKSKPVDLGTPDAIFRNNALQIQNKDGGKLVSEKISKLMKKGYKQKQAIAIAFNMKKNNLGLGGVIKGHEDSFKYLGNTHANGGIDVNSKGIPSKNSINEVEHNEVTVELPDGESYIFSQQLKI